MDSNKAQELFEYGMSAAQLVFGRPIRDFLPIKPGQFSPSEVWMDTREKRELALRDRFLRGAERWSRNTRDLKPLQIGQKVLIQNQHGAGKIALKWDRSGTVIEDLGYNKYRVRVDGSGRVTDRNRQYLRHFSPATPSQPAPSTGTAPGPTTPSQQTAPSTGTAPAPPASAPPSTAADPSTPSSTSPSNSVETEETQDDFVTPPSSPQTFETPETQSPQPPVPDPVTPTLRRSSRRRQQNILYPSSDYDLRRR